MIARVLVVVSLVLAVLALFGVGIDPLTPLREVALGLGLLAIASLL